MRCAARVASAFLLVLCSAGRVLADDAKPAIDAAFAQMSGLKDMLPGQSYTVEVGGVPETGPKERFLRRRAADEILKSGLSCGCGDYAAVFITLMERQGFQAELVDGAAISTESLASHFSGHAVVAVRRTEQDAWWLVNSTDRTVLSRDWSPTAKNFGAFGSFFWIGYRGPMAAYPAHNADELRQFYAATLRSVPRSFLNEHIRRLKFVVDRSLVDGHGGYLNPRLAAFLAMQSRILSANRVHPAKAVTVRLVKGGDDAHSSIAKTSTGQWVATIGLQSGCSAGLLGYLEFAVAR